MDDNISRTENETSISIHNHQPKKEEKSFQAKEFEILLNDTQRKKAMFDIQQQMLLQESAEMGGPSSIQDAVLQALKICKLSVRNVAPKINISRRVLQDMLDGRRSITVEVVSKLYPILAAARPDVFDEQIDVTT